MSSSTDGGPEAISAREKERSRLAMRLVTNSMAVIWALIAGVIVLAILQGFNPTSTVADKIQPAFDKILTGVLPLLGAWIGAIIAFYFASENYDAAARNLRESRSVSDQLASIFARDVMVPAAKLVTAASPGEDATPLKSGIMPRLEERGLGRLIVVEGAATADHAPPANAVAKGVVHDSVINRFIATRLAASAKEPDVTLATLLADTEVSRLIGSSVVYVTPNTTLAEVRAKMDEASKNAAGSVRDALVTANGKAGEPLLGYITDIDIGEKGALK